MSRKLLIAIPALNEEGSIESITRRCLDARAEIVADSPVDYVEITVVSDGSTDGTAELGHRLSEKYPRLRVLELPEPDYGGAMREGFLAATGDWVVNSDIDYFSGAFLARVVAVAADTDVVLASKRDPESDDRHSPVRRLATWGFNQVLRIMLGSKVSDTHGIKALRREVIADVAADVISRQDLFDTELVIRAEKRGWRIKELPIVVEEQREAKSNLLSRVPRTLRGVWRIRRALRS